MSYRIEFVRQASKQFKSLFKQEQKRIKTKVDALATEPRPRGVVKLSGKDSLYRIRAGNYRIIYSIQDKQLLVLAIDIGYRRDVYR